MSSPPRDPARGASPVDTTPAAEASVAEASVAEASVAEASVAEASVARASVARASVVKKPTAKASAATASAANTAGRDVSPIPCGTVLEGKFLVRKELGRGSMGIVYLGRDLSLEREIALKALQPQFAKKKRLAERFKLEAVAMAAVRAENVVQIFTYGEYENHPYFVMEYVPGFTVASLIERTAERQEQLYLDVVLGILRQVCRGLQAVHARGIVHRDIKPANMLVGPQFKVSITDFGLVETGAKLKERDLAGTPLYLAPELIRRQRVDDGQRFRADIYALGVSAYEMLAGDVPFDGTSIKAILRGHLHDAPPPISDYRVDIPAGVQDVLEIALAKDPADRYASCEDFIRDLEQKRREASAAPKARAGTPRFLVVDQDAETRTVCQTALRVAYPTGVVHATSDPLDALELARSTAPQVVFTAVDGPGTDGIDLVAAMRKDEALQQINVIAMGAPSKSQDRQALKNLGVTAFIEKPVELSALLSMTRTITSP